MLTLLLTACAAPRFTTDDGRKVDETLLSNIRLYGRTEQAIRPAIVRSAGLKDAECDKQWELPFAVASSAEWAADDRVAWVRALGVDERLTVIASAAGPADPRARPGAAGEALLPPRVGDRIVGIDGQRRAGEDAQALSELLATQRDRGLPFTLGLSDGRRATAVPFEVCRGYTRVAPPNAPRTQDYHWLMSVHPLQLGEALPDEDEALWAVLWTQGLSEEGGARMKTYHYGTQALGTIYNVLTIASGLRGAALAAEAALKAAQSAAGSIASDILRQQLLQQAQDFAARRLRDSVLDSAQRLGTARAVSVMEQAAVNRGLLSGVARVGATVFDRADRWAFDRAARLQADPLAGFTLHQKFVERGLADNALVFDAERLAALSKAADARGLGDAVVAALDGLRLQALAMAVDGMPLASAPRGFAYDDALRELPQGRFAAGFIAETLVMPVESAK